MVSPLEVAINFLRDFGLFVVAASNVVGILQESLPLVTLVLIIILSLMLLVGSFMGTGEFSFNNFKYTKYFLVILIIISVIAIFLQSTKTSDGSSVLENIIDYIKENWFTGPVFSGFVLLVIIILVIIYVLDVLPGGSAG